jgi:hypothetical protein
MLVEEVNEHLLPLDTRLEAYSGFLWIQEKRVVS